ncbi:bifunctional lysine ketoglutarate reductase /saccharopine dehydrogenase family protein [Candidatus Uabimicrobium amorphum]|uniref:Alanine dehydrogenase n=1 Tax=Uabimicrobium amorphum TaxID=2596890 RepID=A0A5S9ING9_UABAM|nr:bifunctional lysine ketoglutarate reductase /saccharopine dehydrogenase family protein [Candidatus Uabimicrobium amorphum]BBM84767.1 alanine dehydrogenase [Candidatus Uabimicrobium amorphum]
MQGTIGIRKEEKDRRVALTPKQIQQLQEQGVSTIVESSSKRAFVGDDYAQVGATVGTDLSSCNIIFGVKEVPIECLLPGKTYCFFSHTIKGQSHNMPLLQQILTGKNSLFDYERVVNDKGFRLIAFGKFAGFAGMIDSLWAYGQRLHRENVSNPLAKVKQANEYDSLEAAKNAIREVGQEISQNGLPAEITPLVCGFTGSGRVSQGAREIYDLLPIVEITPEELLSSSFLNENSNKVVYKVHFADDKIVVPKEKDKACDFNEYLESPEKYESCFAQYAAHLSILINGIYWEPRYPRLLTIDNLKDLYSQENPRLKVIGDITCDIGGSVEFTVKATKTVNPVFVYDPFVQKDVDGFEGKGVVVLAVDNLPGEIPKESSATFGEGLLPFVAQLAKADYSVPFSDLDIPEPFKRAMIVHNGQLTEEYTYLQRYLS